MATQKLSNNCENSEVSQSCEYEPSPIISPMFGLNHKTIVSPKNKRKKVNNNSTKLEQYIEQKTKDNILVKK